MTSTGKPTEECRSMRVLAIETSGPVGSVAAVSAGDLVGDVTLPGNNGSAQSLAPALKSLLETVGWRTKDVELVAVTIGPGSFTGLRIGVTAAKTLAYTVGAQVLGIDTLETIAAGCPLEIRTLATAMDAQRGQVVTRGFDRGPDGWFSASGPWELADLDAWLASLPPGAWVSGPVLRDVPQASLAHVRLVGAQFWSPNAATLGRLATRRYLAGDRDDLWALTPRYFRRSAAEEKWERKSRGPG
jgi:tRNA threonylcarbamoyladenosine biosynthesis protein TsaB